MDTLYGSEVLCTCLDINSTEVKYYNKDKNPLTPCLQTRKHKNQTEYVV